MKAIQVIGFKNSGKSSLISQLAKRFKKTGSTVCILKHAHHLTIPEKDENALQYAEKYMLASDKGAILYIPSPLLFLQSLAFLNADYLILEGFKGEHFIPRIICWKNKNEKKDLASGIEIGDCGPGEWESDSKINKLIKAIEKKAFLLPGIDCGQCDCITCQEMARQILAGKRSLLDCVTLNEDTKVTINGKQIALNPFVAQLMKNTFGGFLKSLKGVVPGNAIIEIQIEP